MERTWLFRGASLAEYTYCSDSHLLHQPFKETYGTETSGDKQPSKKTYYRRKHTIGENELRKQSSSILVVS